MPVSDNKFAFVYKICFELGNLYIHIKGTMYL